jgi:hypothetical protein
MCDVREFLVLFSTLDWGLDFGCRVIECECNETYHGGVLCSTHAHVI